MDDTISSHPIDDFDAAWQIVGQQYQPAIQVTSALIKLTRAGEQPVEVERLATATVRPMDEALALARQFLNVNLQDGLVHLDLSAVGTSARYRLQIGARTIDASGCAPDIVWAALLVDTPIHAQAICPATGTLIRVDFTPDGVERVEPPSTVIAVISPLAPQLQQLTSREQADADVCAQQPFFASAEAAADWQAQHPGGRIFPVREFFAWWRRFLTAMDVDIP
jgi:alkylmercury lyase